MDDLPEYIYRLYRNGNYEEAWREENKYWRKQAKRLKMAAYQADYFQKHRAERLAYMKARKLARHS